MVSLSRFTFFQSLRAFSEASAPSLSRVSAGGRVKVQQGQHDGNRPQPDPGRDRVDKVRFIRLPDAQRGGALLDQKQQLLRVHGLDQIAEPHDLFHLVALQMPDEMEPGAGVGAASLPCFSEPV